MSFAHPSPPNIHMEGLVNLAMMSCPQNPIFFNIRDILQILCQSPSILQISFQFIWILVVQTTIDEPRKIFAASEQVFEAQNLCNLLKQRSRKWYCADCGVCYDDLEKLRSFRVVFRVVSCCCPVLCLIFFCLQQRLQLIREALADATVLDYDRMRIWEVRRAGPGPLQTRATAPTDSWHLRKV